MIGILPTVMPEHFEGDWMSANTRYQALNDAVLAARGEDIYLDIEGSSGEKLDRYADSLAPESACTSMQLHLQVDPSSFANYWNAAQVLAGPQLGVGANSPYFFGQQLARDADRAVQPGGRHPGGGAEEPGSSASGLLRRALGDVDLRPLRGERALLPGPAPGALRGGPSGRPRGGGGFRRWPSCGLHNGTVYRWNRPIYDTHGSRPHLRVENRVLPAGSSIIDVMANAAFYYGALRMLTQEDRPVWTRMSFVAAEDNFFRRARRDRVPVLLAGSWRDRHRSSSLRHLLPLAHEGLTQWGVARRCATVPSVIEGRCLSGRNGASWQIEATRRLEEAGSPSARGAAADARGVRREHAHSNAPVHPPGRCP